MAKNAGEYICTLYYLLHISVNLKLLQKITKNKVYNLPTPPKKRAKQLQHTY